MAVDRVFAAAYIDNGNTHRVLGVKLLPFCAWHLFQLQVVDSPFLNSGTVYLYHLRRAVGIARLRFPDSRTRLPIFPLRMTQKKLNREMIRFLTYIGDYLQKPDYTIVPPDELVRRRRVPRIVGQAPEIVQLVFDAAHGARITVPEAWMLPIGQAYIAQAMHRQKAGDTVDFMTDKERGFQATLKAHMAAATAKARNGEKR